MPKKWKAPQDEATRAKALSDNGKAAPPTEHQRCWHCFPDLPAAGVGDWYGNGNPGESERCGQPLKRFLQPGPHRCFPTRQRRKIYLAPLGDVSSAPSPQVFRDLLQRWFLLECEVMPSMTTKELEAIERNPTGCGYGPQLECPSATQALYAKKPKDAYIVLGYSMEDLCDTRKGFQFLFGQANLDLGCGMFSFARYGDDVALDSPRFLRRCGMVLCHEAMHLLGIKHCVYASCIMNGSNHLDESEARPWAACPVDLRKLQLTLDQAKIEGKASTPVDLVARERAMAAFFYAHGLHADAKFSRGVAAALTGQPEREAGSEAEREPMAMPAAVADEAKDEAEVGAPSAAEPK